MSDEANETTGRVALPRRGTDWPTLEKRRHSLAEGDVDWRQGRTAVYVFNAGKDVLRVAKDAYSLFQSENALVQPPFRA